MSTTWPEDSLGHASLSDVFDEALRPKVPPYVLRIPTRVEEQGPEAVAAWVRENHPGYPVILVPEERPVRDWVGMAQAWQRLSPEQRARRARDWVAAFEQTNKA